MPEVSVTYPPQRLRTMVRDELRATFERSAQRGAMRLGIPREAVSAAMRHAAAAAVLPPTEELAKAARVATVAPAPAPTPTRVAAPAPAPTPTRVAAPTPAPTPTRVAAPTPAPAPSPTITRRVAALQLGALEASEMNPYFVDQPYTHQLGQLQIPREFLRRTVVAAPVSRTMLAPSPAPQQQPYVGYPVVTQEEEPDWTTYAMIGLAVVAVGGGVWYLKKTKKI